MLYDKNYLIDLKLYVKTLLTLKRLVHLPTHALTPGCVCHAQFFSDRDAITSK